MRIDILTVVPGLLNGGPLETSIIGRARKKGLAEIFIHDLRDFAVNRYGQVDDYQFGGGAGMVIMIEPVARCIDKLKAERTYDEVIFMCPDGKTLNQKMANTLSMKGNLLILCGHYKGIDERIREHYITQEISIGDFVLTGGELAAAVLADAVIRLIPGAISDEESALSDSFQDNLLAPPVYTRPSEYNGWKVPGVLLSGDFKKIEEWRTDQAFRRTQERRPDLLEDMPE
jgi:tRNA (guanine37-N1)-methyltransferase